MAQFTFEYPGNQVLPFYEALDTAGAVAALRTRLKGLEENPYLAHADITVTNSLESVREWLSDGAREVADKRPPIGGYYSELNGFSINPDLWAADLAGTPEFGPDAVDSYFDLRMTWAKTRLALEGTAKAQATYQRAMDSEGFGPEWREASYVSDFLIQALFVDLIHRAWVLGPIEHVVGPMLVTAHDMEPLVYLPAH